MAIRARRESFILIISLVHNDESRAGDMTEAAQRLPVLFDFATVAIALWSRQWKLCSDLVSSSVTGAWSLLSSQELSGFRRLLESHGAGGEGRKDSVGRERPEPSVETSVSVLWNPHCSRSNLRGQQVTLLLGDSQDFKEPSSQANIEPVNTRNEGM
ncbi:hypothetical protein SRHO_G00283360 [Serrasalmus rhombeus]